MSDNKPSNSENEEVDLGQMFNAIGKLFEKLFLFIGKVLKGLFEIVIYALKPIVKNFKIISIVVLGAAILGFVMETFEEPTFESSMTVRPYFNSKYQLATNIDHFNALISTGNIQELSRLFEIDSVQAESLVGFDLDIGPETSSELLRQYNNYLSTTDTSIVRVEIPYDEFLEQRQLLDAEIFSITAMARSNDVFVGLEKGFSKTFENDYSQRLREKRDDTIQLRKTSLEKQLEEIKRLQNVYIKVIESEADNPEVSIGPEGMFPLQQTKRETKEFDLMQREIQIRSSINRLEEQLVKDNSYFDIVSRFDPVGTKSRRLMNNNVVMFPLLVLATIILVYILFKSFLFIKDYGE